MKQLIGSFLVAALPAMASTSQECNVEFQGGLHITNSAIEFSEQDQLRYKIQGRSLLVGGRQIILNQAQADAVQTYGDGIHALVPQAQQLAHEGVAIAADALTMVLQEFSGVDAGVNVQRQFSLLQADIDKSFQSPQGIHLGQGNSAGFMSSKEFESAFEQNVQKIVDDLGSEIAWNTLKMVGWSIFSGKDTQEFEARMENFGKQVEQAMDQRARKLEGKAQQLCVSLVELDKREGQLKAAIPELQGYDFIVVTSKTASR